MSSKIKILIPLSFTKLYSTFECNYLPIVYFFFFYKFQSSSRWSIIKIHFAQIKLTVMLNELKVAKNNYKLKWWQIYETNLLDFDLKKTKKKFFKSNQTFLID